MNIDRVLSRNDGKSAARSRARFRVSKLLQALSDATAVTDEPERRQDAAQHCEALFFGLLSVAHATDRGPNRMGLRWQCAPLCYQPRRLVWMGRRKRSGRRRKCWRIAPPAMTRYKPNAREANSAG